MFVRYNFLGESVFGGVYSYTEVAGKIYFVLCKEKLFFHAERVNQRLLFKNRYHNSSSEVVAQFSLKCFPPESEVLGHGPVLRLVLHTHHTF